MKRITFSLALVLVGTSAGAADWPQWQGPDRNAISRETGLLKEWPADGPRLAWKINGLGGGDSAPAVSEGKLFGMSIRDGKEIVWALAEANGKEMWSTPLGNAVQQSMPQSKEGPACTPAVDVNRLYVIGMGGKVACLSADDGKLVWERSFTQDFGGGVPAWSYRESPLVDGDQVICTPGGPDAIMVALNKQTGKTIWKAKLPGTAAQPAGERPVATNRPETNRPAQPNAPAGNAGGGAPTVEGTKEPGLFLSEHWGMTGFSHKVSNGKYLVKLYFAETYQGITAAGQRVFSFAVHGKEFKDFDIWEKSGGFRRAYIEPVPVEVTDGAVRITFTSKTNSPAIKAIEIIPQSDKARDTETIRIKAGQTTPFTDASGKVWFADQGFEGGQLSPGTFNFGGGGFGGRPGAGRGGFGGFGGFGPSVAAYSSVIAIDFEGQRQYVQLTGSALIGVSSSDGKFLWRYDRPANRMGINCSTPIFQGGLIFAASAYGTGGGAVKLVKDTKGAITPEEVYFSNSMQNHHGGMIVADGCLYGANGGNEGGFLTCMEFKTGKVLWRDRNAPKGSLLLADNRLYLRTESGTMLLIEPSREGLVERGRFEQPDRSNPPAWAHPIIANGKLYIRDQDMLLCYDIRAN